MQNRVHCVVRVIRELHRALASALRARRIEDAPPRAQEDTERELRVCRDTLRAAVDAMEELTTQVQQQALRYRELVEFVSGGDVATDPDGAIRRANAPEGR